MQIAHRFIEKIVVLPILYNCKRYAIFNLQNSFNSMVKSFIYEDFMSVFSSYSTKAAKNLLAAFVFTIFQNLIFIRE